MLRTDISYVLNDYVLICSVIIHQPYTEWQLIEQ